MKLHWRCTKVGLHIIFWRHFKAELSKLQNIKRWENIRSSSYAPLIIYAILSICVLVLLLVNLQKSPLRSAFWPLKFLTRKFSVIFTYIMLLRYSFVLVVATP
jgi:hypothetical protein